MRAGVPRGLRPEHALGVFLGHRGVPRRARPLPTILLLSTLMPTFRVLSCRETLAKLQRMLQEPAKVRPNTHPIAYTVAPLPLWLSAERRGPLLAAQFRRATGRRRHANDAAARRDAEGGGRR